MLASNVRSSAWNLMMGRTTQPAGLNTRTVVAHKQFSGNMFSGVPGKRSKSLGANKKANFK